MTFSIVAYDPQTEAWGVAGQSKFVAIGALTPWAKAGVGTIATVAFPIVLSLRTDFASNRVRTNYASSPYCLDVHLYLLLTPGHSQHTST
jgi:Family of unknown function (DUF1028)